MKWIGEAKRLHATLPIVATLGGIHRYRRLVTDPQQVRKWTRNGAIVPTILVAYYSWGQATTRRQSGAGDRTPPPARPFGWPPHDPKARLLGLLRPIWAFVVVELLIGKRRNLSRQRAILLALEPAVYVAVAQALRSRARDAS
jgi:hypothetical protein